MHSPARRTQCPTPQWLSKFKITDEPTLKLKPAARRSLSVPKAGRKLSQPRGLFASLKETARSQLRTLRREPSPEPPGTRAAGPGRPPDADRC